MAAPIDLYYWPTPNGWKITIMLEELGAPYTVHYVNISRGDQFEPDFLKIAPNNRNAGHCRSGRPGWGTDLGVRIRGDPAISWPQVPSLLSDRGAARVEVDQWLFWQMGGLGPMAARPTISAITRRKRSPMASIAIRTRSTVSTA